MKLFKLESEVVVDSEVEIRLMRALVETDLERFEAIL